MLEEVKEIVAETLGLGPRIEHFEAESPLLGHVPELDSMAAVQILTALEEHYGIVVEDDEIDAATFATLGSLSGYVESKLDR